MLSALALASCAYRYGVVWPRTGGLGFADDAPSVATIVLHVLLGASGMFFRVPTAREEDRLHAVLFTVRGMLAYVVGALRMPLTPPSAVTRYLVMMHVHVIVDEVTGHRAATRPRGDALYEVLALASHLWPTSHADMGFNAMIAVTRWRGQACCMALSAAFVLYQLHSLEFVVLTLAASVLRLTLRANKYVTWALFSAGAYIMTA